MGKIGEQREWELGVSGSPTVRAGRRELRSMEDGMGKTETKTS